METKNNKGFGFKINDWPLNIKITVAIALIMSLVTTAIITVGHNMTRISMEEKIGEVVIGEATGLNQTISEYLAGYVNELTVLSMSSEVISSTKRKIFSRIIYEKIPFIAISISMSIFTIFFHKKHLSALRYNHIGLNLV